MVWHKVSRTTQATCSTILHCTTQTSTQVQYSNLHQDATDSLTQKCQVILDHTPPRLPRIRVK